MKGDMKKNTKIALLVLFVGLITGCEDFKLGNAFLEKPMGDDVNIDTVFAHKKYAEQALNQAYRSLPDYLPLDGGYRGSWINTDGPTDICFDATKAYTQNTIVASSYRQFPYSFITEQHIGNPMYGIRKAYIYIENVDRVPDMTDNEKLTRKAEAKMIIAYHYSQLLRHYGGVPWIDRAYSSEDAFLFPRMTVAETVDKIVNLLDEAAKDLPWYAAPEDNGRMTAAAAKALKLRVRLFAASPLLNSEAPYAAGEAASQKLCWYGDYKKERWEDALAAGREFMRENQKYGNYHRIEKSTGNPREDFVNGYFVRGSQEIIMPSHRFAIYDFSTKTLDRGHNDCQISTRASYADMFQWKDGSAFDWENPEHRAHPFFDENGLPTRDIRLYETLLINQDKFQSRKAECYQGGRESKEQGSFSKSSKYGYSVRKFVRDRGKGQEAKNKPYQCPLIRMPEVYLSIAEAMNELGMAKTKDEFGRNAYDYINAVRSRAGMPDVPQVEGAQLRDIILHESAVEFGSEEVRYFNLIRWKRIDLLSTPLEKLNIVLESGNPQTFAATFRYETTTTDEKYPWKEFWYLLAFPQDEINKKYGLIQNPGW